jgi:hypothetical protein
MNNLDLRGITNLTLEELPKIYHAFLLSHGKRPDRILVDKVLLDTLQSKTITTLEATIFEHWMRLDILPLPEEE